MAHGQRIGFDDARRFARVAFNGRMSYRNAADVSGTALVSDVSRGGLRMYMGRYLRPGTRVMIEADGVRVDGHPVELKGYIVWCAPEKRDHRFAAGVRIIYDEPDAVAGVSAVMDHALHQAGVIEELRTRAMSAPATAPVWQFRAARAQARITPAQFVGNA